MTPDETMFAIGLDYGMDGVRPPLTIVRTRKEAEAVAKIIREAHGSIYCVEVQVWPGVGEVGGGDG